MEIRVAAHCRTSVSKADTTLQWEEMTDRLAENGSPRGIIGAMLANRCASRSFHDARLQAEALI